MKKSVKSVSLVVIDFTDGRNGLAAGGRGSGDEREKGWTANIVYAQTDISSEIDEFTDCPHRSVPAGC